MINGFIYPRFVTIKVVQPQVHLSIDWQKEDYTTQNWMIDFICLQVILISYINKENLTRYMVSINKW